MASPPHHHIFKTTVASCLSSHSVPQERLPEPLLGTQGEDPTAAGGQLIGESREHLELVPKLKPQRKMGPLS